MPLTVTTIEKALSWMQEDMLWDLGQIDKKVVNKLNRMAKKGEITKEKAFWPHYHCGSMKKNVYYF